MTTNKKYYSIFIIIGVLIAVGYYISIPYFKIGGEFDISYDNQDLGINFINKKNEIYKLTDYFLQILPERKGVSFGFDDRTDRYYFIIREFRKNGNIEYHTGENLKKDSDEFIKLLNIIGWHHSELQILLEKLKSANCIGIFKQPYENIPVNITFRYGEPWGVAKFSYYVFPKPLNDSLIKVWNKKEGFVRQNDSLYFEYGYPL